MLGDLIPLYLRTMGLEQSVNISRIYSAWEMVVGEKSAACTVSRNFRNGKLYCRINSPVIKNRLFMERGQIRDKINTLLTSDIVKEIVLL